MSFFSGAINAVQSITPNWVNNLAARAVNIASNIPNWVSNAASVTSSASQQVQKALPKWQTYQKLKPLSAGATTALGAYGIVKNIATPNTPKGKGPHDSFSKRASNAANAVITGASTAYLANNYIFPGLLTPSITKSIAAGAILVHQGLGATRQVIVGDNGISKPYGSWQARLLGSIQQIIIGASAEYFIYQNSETIDKVFEWIVEGSVASLGQLTAFLENKAAEAPREVSSAVLGFTNEQIAWMYLTVYLAVAIKKLFKNSTNAQPTSQQNQATAPSPSKLRRIMKNLPHITAVTAGIFLAYQHPETTKSIATSTLSNSASLLGRFASWTGSLAWSGVKAIPSLALDLKFWAEAKVLEGAEYILESVGKAVLNALKALGESLDRAVDDHFPTA